MKEPSTPMKKAVALRYAPEKSNAPQLIAKGKGRVAESILQTAEENGIPIQQDASLVEVLSKLDLEQEIPSELYELVAEVLSFIYRSDNRMGRGSGHL
ncbi:EscU/YscU/HrcU family type III secretion system export apparatus switch protein [Paenibacillus eucommiae]|uniref:Flagellar biosynthesis protein n=1 Tax=Paenibacillus eucommiae TaxID=1355755 RepID=A0ABS4IUU0_9BACL|nr:EscU/YscU/HrcU family type III secretion system export apparatus switch protein [Paenibacillus eucommiae]MBP1991357.1 flagellar biosynthesis protein [Paenibacillus eucommiae]